MAIAIALPEILSIVLRYVVPLVLSGIFAWWLVQSGSAVTQGIQQAAPGIGAAIGSVGMMFSLLPVFFMMMMFMWMMTTFMKVFT